MTSEPPRRAETKSIWPALPSNSAGPTSAQEHAFAPRISISIHDHSAARVDISARRACVHIHKAVDRETTWSASAVAL